jgi:hypothetical protein
MGMLSAALGRERRLWSSSVHGTRGPSALFAAITETNIYGIQTIERRIFNANSVDPG